MNTLYLDPESWDLALDAEGNIALSAMPHAQDVASAARLFAGEAWYDTDRGIPYFDETLGGRQPFALYRHRLIEAALSVPGVDAAEVDVAMDDGRVLSGSLKVGQYAVENFGFAGHLDALRGKSERGNMCHRAIS